MAVTLQSSPVSWSGMLNSSAPYGHDLSITVSAGENRLLVVLVGGCQADFTATANGSPMTAGIIQTGGAAPKVGMFYLVNPPVGTYNVSVNDSSWAASQCSITAFVLNGVDQATPFGSSHSEESPYGSSPRSSSLTSGVNDALISILSLYSSTNPSIAVDDTALSAQLSWGTNFYSRASYSLGSDTAIGYTFGGSDLQTALLSYVVNGAAGNAAPTTISATLANITGSVSSKSNPKTAISATLANITASVGSTVGTLTTTITATLGNVVGSITSTGSTTNGTFTSEVLKDYAGNVLANTALNFVRFYNDTTGALVLNKTGVSTNGSGIVTFSDAALVAGTTYRVDWETAAGSRRMPRKAAA